MSTSILLVATATGTAAAILWRLIVRASRRPSRNGGRPEAYHCVSITCPDLACDAVKRVRAHRFLSDEAPLLPLPGCTAPECRCRYAHFPDRREDLRRNPYGLRSSLPPSGVGSERRDRTDRRAPAALPSRPGTRV